MIKITYTFTVFNTLSFVSAKIVKIKKFLHSCRYGMKTKTIFLTLAYLHKMNLKST